MGGDSAWRPLRDAVVDWPLAICDSRTFDPELDSLAADVVYPDSLSEDVLVHHNTEQNWYYYPEQTPDELLLFRGLDSKEGLAAGVLSNVTVSCRTANGAVSQPVHMLPSTLGFPSMRGYERALTAGFWYSTILRTASLWKWVLHTDQQRSSRAIPPWEILTSGNTSSKLLMQ